MIVQIVSAPSLGSDQFTDVPSDHTFHNDIAWLAEVGVTRGCNPPANTEFCPQDLVSRGQMAAFLVRALELPDGTASFVDTGGSVFAGDISALAAAGITRGCDPPDNTRFCPESPVTRGQMAAFLTRALELPSGTAQFADTSGHVFAGDIAALATAGITSGCNPPDNTRFCPDEYVTRGQMAAFLHRALATELAPADTALRDIEEVAQRGSYSFESFELDGRDYVDSLTYDTANVQTGYVEFLLGRDYTHFCAVVGVWDRTRWDDAVDAEITLDGEIIWNEVVFLGKPEAVKVSVEDALRMRLTFREAVVDGSYVEAGWGSAVVASDGDCDIPTGDNPSTPSIAYLYDADPIYEFDREEPLELDGELYPRSIRQTTANSLDGEAHSIFYLGRDYERFCAAVAVPDDFVYPDATADFSVKGDGDTLVSGLAEMGQVTHLEVPVDDVLRLTLVINEGAGPTSYTQVGWGDARVVKGSC